jgi:hypothetical protein
MRHERPLLVKDGITDGQFGLWFRLPRKSQGSLTCRKSATWDRTALLPLRRKACWGFFSTEKFDGFGRDRSRGCENQTEAITRSESEVWCCAVAAGGRWASLWSTPCLPYCSAPRVVVNITKIWTFKLTVFLDRRRALWHMCTDVSVEISGFVFRVEKLGFVERSNI